MMRRQFVALVGIWTIVMGCGDPGSSFASRDASETREPRGDGSPGSGGADAIGRHDSAADVGLVMDLASRTEAAGVDRPSQPTDAPAGAGRWSVHFMGTGRIEDIATGNPIDLPLERRAQVLMLPEGYTRADLDARVFDMDIDRWMSEVFLLEPFATFKQAFVIWKINLASNARPAAADPQTADTAFKLPLTADGIGVSRVAPETATALWNALGDLPVASDFSFVRGARNIVAYMHVLDPRLGRAGLSGITRTVTNPRTAAQRISLAIALGRAHEFTHAFSLVTDEYIETMNTNPTPNDRTTTSAGITNVVASPSCGTLPWRHLLRGTTINPGTDQLVGAFGTAAQGYHPELKCLMNGTHENATVFGGNGNLRTSDRMCNFCRELTAFRLYERTSILADSAVSLGTWTSTYRAPFFAKYGFKVPVPVPQQSSDGQAWWQPCAP